jgi:hypothetical protein
MYNFVLLYIAWTLIKLLVEMLKSSQKNIFLKNKILWREVENLLEYEIFKFN